MKLVFCSMLAGRRYAMYTIQLVAPTENFRAQAEKYKQEHFEYRETSLHGSSLFDSLDFDEWLKLVKNNSDETTVISGWVMSSTFFAVRKSDEAIIGMVNIRHTLNKFLQKYGGNIGYGVCPSERNKGYATQILNLALDFCKTIELNDVMISCYKDNVASRNTILKCGGILERECIHYDNKIMQVFWVSL